MDRYDKQSLSNIQKYFAYFDSKSLEKSTLKINGKYKLAGKPLQSLNLYPFFVLTKTKETCFSYLRLCIEKKDWINRKPKYLEEDKSYTDLKNRVETLSAEELLKKIRDKENGFIVVAQLCKGKCTELQELMTRVFKSKKQISKESKRILALTLESSDEILKKLGL